MQSFITIQHNAKGPAFSTFDTIQAAKGHLMNLISSEQVDAYDTLAIVRSSDDSVVYFKQRNNTIASLNAAFNQRTTGFSTQSVYQMVKEQILLVFTALTSTSGRR